MASEYLNGYFGAFYFMVMAKKEQLSAIQILSDIKKGVFYPIYFLMGEEPYFIDKITDALVAKVILPEERDFNMTMLYGGETTVEMVITAARRFPMMAEHQLVVVKEAQQLDKMDLLENYTRQPLKSTVLVINYKHKTFDTRKKLMKDIAACGIVFESKKIYDNKLPDFINQYVMTKGMAIEPKAVSMLSDFVGADLNRLCGELDKLCISPSIKNNRITATLVEQNVGISKDFNNFELVKAVASRNIYMANLIQHFFAKNPKDNPLVVTLTVLFNYFANLMLCYYAPNKSESGLMEELNIRNAFFIKDYVVGMKTYNAFKVMQNISLIRAFDAKAKGMEGSYDDGELLKELLFRLMH